MQQPVSQDFYQNIKAILEQTVQFSPYCAVSFAMVMAYWEIGRLIVEEEQQGKKRAESEEKVNTLRSELTWAHYR